MKCRTVIKQGSKDEVFVVDGLEHQIQPYAHIPLGRFRFPVGERLSKKYPNTSIERAIVIITKARRTMMLVEEREPPKLKENPSRTDILLEERRTKFSYIPEFNENLIVHIRSLDKYMSIAGSPKPNPDAELIDSACDPYEGKYVEFEKKYPAHPSVFDFIPRVRFLSVWEQAPNVHEYLVVMTPGSSIRIRTKKSKESQYRDYIVDYGTIRTTIKGEGKTTVEEENKLFVMDKKPKENPKKPSRYFRHEVKQCPDEIERNDAIERAASYLLDEYDEDLSAYNSRVLIEALMQADGEIIELERRMSEYKAPHTPVIQEEYDELEKKHAHLASRRIVIGHVLELGVSSLRDDAHFAILNLNDLQQKYDMDVNDRRRILDSYDAEIEDLERINRTLMELGQTIEEVSSADINWARNKRENEAREQLNEHPIITIDLSGIAQRIINIERMIADLERSIANAETPGQVLLFRHEIDVHRRQIEVLRQMQQAQRADVDALAEEMERLQVSIRSIEHIYDPGMPTNQRNILQEDYDNHVRRITEIRRWMVEHHELIGEFAIRGLPDEPLNESAQPTDDLSQLLSSGLRNEIEREIERMESRVQELEHLRLIEDDGLTMTQLADQFRCNQRLVRLRAWQNDHPSEQAQSPDANQAELPELDANLRTWLGSSSNSDDNLRNWLNAPLSEGAQRASDAEMQRDAERTRLLDNELRRIVNANFYISPAILWSIHRLDRRMTLTIIRTISSMDALREVDTLVDREVNQTRGDAQAIWMEIRTTVRQVIVERERMDESRRQDDALQYRHILMERVEHPLLQVENPSEPAQSDAPRTHPEDEWRGYSGWHQQLLAFVHMYSGFEIRSDEARDEYNNIAVQYAIEWDALRSQERESTMREVVQRRAAERARARGESDRSESQDDGEADVR